MWKWLANLTRSLMNEVADKAVERMARDQYTENLFELVPVARKVGPVNLMETVMRANLGLPPARPLGSYRHFSPWEQFLFNPVHLFRFPTPEDVMVDTAVTIGPRAKKPLTIAIPIMVAAMSFGGALSKSAKIALAKGASMIGTATNTGEAGLLKEEREAARLLIGQYNRGGWLNTPEKYRQLDAIEIQLGQGAQGSTPQRTSAKNIGPDFRDTFELPEGASAQIRSRLPGVNTKEDFMALVRQLREETGVPVGLKIAATHHLEQELQIALAAGVDFITVDGAEGGTHAAAPTLEDDLGLPTLFAVTRAAKYLWKQKAVGKVSLIATGGLRTPGDCLKALALGADAVYLGTVAVMAMVGDQAAKAMPFEPPTSLIVYNAKATAKLDVERSARNLFRFLNATVREMELVCLSLGKTSLNEVTRSDLCTLDPFLAQATGVDLAYVAHDEQQSFFEAWRRPTEVPPFTPPAEVYTEETEMPRLH
ncbi:MAG: FMN-binding glutamate synthase family protein [Bacillota bacterium]